MKLYRWKVWEYGPGYVILQGDAFGAVVYMLVMVDDDDMSRDLDTVLKQRDEFLKVLDS